MALIVKRAAEKAGLDPDKYAGHSLRAGLATSAAQAGVSERSIMAQADSSGPDERARLKVRFRQSDCTACQNRAKCVRSEAG